jgi:hypothetical protein
MVRLQATYIISVPLVHSTTAAHDIYLHLVPTESLAVRPQMAVN